ncbi:MAG: membrane protein insertase YidC, partial [Chlorobiaceae bacterium]|nr:membrane protein insertase YidC [Chlorobiaceae bacterium]
MDKNSVTGLALIAIIMIVWLQFMSPAKKPQQQPQAPTTGQAAVQSPQNPAQVPSPDADFGAFAAAATGREQLTTVENDLFRATLSSKGATLKSLVLKKHLDGNRKPFNLVTNSGKGALSLLFQTKDDQKKIDTRDLYFSSLSVDTLRTISGKQTCSVIYHLDVTPGRRLDITYLFSGQSYKVDYDVRMTGLASELVGGEYQLQWDGGLA